jgi:hypothetical protein
LAQQVWDYYWSIFGDNERINLPPMRVLRYVELSQILNNEAYPLYIREGLWKRIEREKPDLLKELQQTGEQLKQQMEQQQKAQKQ